MAEATQTESLARQLIEQGAWADGCSVLTCGATTGHFVKPIAFCDSPEVATILAAALSLTDEGRIVARIALARESAQS